MQRTFSGLDILKVVAAIGIVAIHTGTPFLNTFGRLGVPFFAITSSFLFFKRYFKQDKEEQFEYLKHFLKRLLILYFCWQVIYLPSAAVYFIQAVHRLGKVAGMFFFLRHFLFPPLPLTNGWGQSWYLIGMIIGLPLFLLLLRIIKKTGMGILSFLLYVFYVSYNSNLSSWRFVKVLPHSVYYFLGTIGNNSFPILLIYIYVGMMVSLLLPEILNSSLKVIQMLCLLMLVLYFVENIIIWIKTGKIDNLTVILTAPASLMLVLMGVKMQFPLKNELFWRRFITFLFCIHVGVVHVFDVIKIIFHVSLTSFLIMALTVVVSYFLYVVFTQLLKVRQMSWLKYLV